MTFMTKSERSELESLSLQLVGNSSAWRRLEKIKMFNGVTEHVEEKMVVVNQGGTKMKMSAAIARGLHSGMDESGQPVDIFTKKQVPQYRKPDFKDIREGMMSALEMKTINSLPESSKLFYAAYKFAKDELLNVPFLVVKENNKGDFESMLALIPAERHEQIANRVVPNGNAQEFCLDGVQFLNEVVFSLTHKDSADKQYVAILEAPAKNA